MIQVWKFIHGARFFIAAGILLAAGVIILGPLGRDSQATSSLVKPPLQVDGGVEALLKQAADAEAQKHLPEAAGLYEKVLAAKPDFASVYLKLRQIYFRSGSSSKAEEAYLKAIDKGLNDPDVFLYLGYIRETRGDLDQALAYYAKAEFSGSRNPVVYFNMGNIHARQGHQDKALEYFKRAVILNPGYMDAFVNLAIISAQTGEYADAEYYLEKAEKLGYDAPVQFKEGLAAELKKK